MNKVKLGIIGCGVIGQMHMKAAKEASAIDLVAIADMNEASAKAAAEKYPVPTVYTKADDLINDKNIDAVVFALPTAGRAELGVKALKSGKHVLLEKPTGMNLKEIDGLLAVQKDRIAASCSCRFRLLPSSQKVTEFISEGHLGELRLVHARIHGAAGARPQKAPAVWRLNRAMNGGGILTNWGTYDVDYLLGINSWKLKPKTVLAQTWNMPSIYDGFAAPGSDGETFYKALIMCEGGIALSLERGEYMAAHSEAAWQIVGSKGSLNLTLCDKGRGKATLDRGDSETGVKQEVVMDMQDAEVGSEHFPGPVSDFANAIVNNTKPKTTIENYRTIQQIFDAIYLSASTGKAVDIKQS